MITINLWSRTREYGYNKTFINKTATTLPSFKGNESVFIPADTHKLIQTNGYIKATDKTRLGANYNKKTGDVDFRLASKNATCVFLSIFDSPKDKDEILLVPMQKIQKTNTWETSIPYEKLGNKPFYYGYRVFGENWNYNEDFFDDKGKIKDPKSGFISIVDEKGNRFNPNKIAHDPYSRELSHLPATSDGDDLAYYSSNTFENNAKYATKSVFSITKDEIIPNAKSRPLTDEIIGEVHIKDLTINEKVKGAGGYLGAKNFAKKIKDSGITMVEFLPLCEFDNNSNSNNYWGYMTLGHFAPVKRYAFDKTAGGALKEFRKMIKEFHKEDIKVCMDVVYNHTGEIAPNNDDINDVRQFSYSLIDNQMYYKQKNGKYNSNSDCKNDINSAEEETMELIADSIAYWANQGVDAFRFDLAVGLMDIDKTEQVNYNPNESLIGKLSEMLKEKGVKVNRPEESGNGIYLIAEPWTCKGANSYQIGKFPDVWAQWNDIARETFKNDSLNPFSSTPSKLRHVIEGTHGIFPNGDKSINYTHSHDGYTLYDNNSIEKRNNDWHFASNYNEDKNRQLMAIKKQIALTLLAKGTPMLQIGDMIGHSKSGDCNSYNQDNETNYLDFSKTKNKNSTEGNIYDFTQKMINFRKKHPVLRSSEFNKNITYYKPDGSFAQPYDNDYWNTNHINTLSYKIEDKNSLFISSSSNDNLVGIKLPQNQNGKKWNLVCDTSLKNSFFDKNVPIENDYYLQNAHSIIILEER